MRTTRQHQPQDLMLVGLNITTRPDRAAQDIPALWQRFIMEDWPGRLKGIAVNTDLYAAYHDYHGDHTAPYSMLIGVLCKPGVLVPEGARCVRMPKGEMAVFQAEGLAAEAIWGVWSYINGPWNERGSRRYLVDLERHDAPAQEAQMRGEPVRVEILVGVQ